ncbi:MAG: hypothetical protein Q8S26_15580 [Azonexus sp.]|nr:hypothetical protein [Azonexus sp.]
MSTAIFSSDERRFLNDRRQSDSGALFIQLDRRKTLQRRVLNLGCNSVADWLGRPLPVPMAARLASARIEAL